MVVLCMVQLGNQSLSILTVCRMRRCANVLEHSERKLTSPVASLGLHVEAGELPNELRRQQLCLQLKIPVNFDKSHATLLSIMYLVLASDVYLILDQNIIPTLGSLSD